MGRFATEVLTQRENLTVLLDLSGQWIDAVHRRKPTRQIILDLDSSVSETYGRQEGSAYNGYFGCECYHRLFCFNQFGDLERAMLREGNVASADDRRPRRLVGESQGQRTRPVDDCAIGGSE